MIDFFKPTILLFTALFSTISIVFEKYIFSDMVFALHLFIIIACDTLLGTILAYKKHNLSSKKFGAVFSKICVYIILLVATQNAANFKVSGGHLSLLSWLDNIVYAAIVAREMLSIFEKTTLLGVFTPPAWIVKRLDIIATTEDGKLIEEIKKETEEDKQ